MKLKSGITLLMIVLLLLTASLAFAKSFGAGLTLDQSSSLSELLANPDPFVGKKVQLTGMVVDVCQKRGCWLYLTGDKPFEKIRVKVTDGEIVFPMEARGKQGTVEGVLEKFVLSREEVIARKRHHAEEQGKIFDPSSVTEGEVVYQLRGLGAEIEGI